MANCCNAHRRKTKTNAVESRMAAVQGPMDPGLHCEYDIITLYYK